MRKITGDPPLYDGVKTFETGAQRGTDKNGARYDLIPKVGLRRLAETCAEGAAKYGEHNWLKGLPSLDLINHALSHINDYLDHGGTEDDLAHACWNLFVVMHNEERRSELHQGLMEGRSKP